MHWGHEPELHKSLNDERNPKPECRKTLGGAFAGFVIRISSFVIRICEEWFMKSLAPPLTGAECERRERAAACFLLRACVPFLFNGRR